MRIFHIATAADWAAAQRSGRYTTSTRGRTLAEEGYIHAARADQWQGVRERFYGDVEEPLVLLTLDTETLDVPVLDETVGTETFPHIYGAINPATVVAVTPLRTSAGGAGAPTQSFFRIFASEVFFRMTTAVVTLLAAVVLAVVADSLWGDDAVLPTAVVVVVLGIVAGVTLSRRRDRRYAAVHPRP